jgi:hypothetical protein
LLLLRASVAIALVLEGYTHRHELPLWIQGAAILVSVALSFGYLTPIVALSGLAIHGLIWVMHGDVSANVALGVTLDAIALSLLGPGAYSADSYRFGRRVVVLPPA